VKFRADLASPETKARIDKDKKQGEEVGLEGTPLIFINGREVDLQLLTNPGEDLEEWVKLDLELLGKTPRPAQPKPAASPGAAPAAPVAPVASGSAPAQPGPAPSAGAAQPRKP
jgi:hypothetical protein